MEVSVQLLEKYSRPGPRYTSYPPAPHFRDGYPVMEWQEELAHARREGGPLSVYVHIPYCDTLCYYCGCNMQATRKYDKAVHYLDYLFSEVDAVLAYAGTQRQAVQMHWGGGSPNFLKPEHMQRLAAFLAERFALADDGEFACELDPRDLTREHLEVLKAAGFNRLSLGVQDLDEGVQKAVNRIQSPAVIEQAVVWMGELGFDNVNMDLMVGLPGQTVDGFAQTLEQVIAWAPQRLAVFNYAHVPWMKKHQKMIREEALPSVQERMALQQLVFTRLEQAGYRYIGMDHFARPGDALVVAQEKGQLYRNFQGYTTHKDVGLLAFGASAISHTQDVYVQNHREVKPYQEAVATGGFAVSKGLRVGQEELMRREMIRQVMCDLALDLDDFAMTWPLMVEQEWSAVVAGLREMEQDGLVELAGHGLRVTALGRVFLRNIAMVFDPLMRESQSGAPRYSKTL